MAILGSIAHMAGLSDQVIATDFLVSAKSAIQNYGIAITEVTSSDLRTTLKNQLNDAIKTHEKISNYMLEKGYYHAYNFQEQKNEIMKITQTALDLKESKQ